MKIKRFFAGDMRSALKLVRDEFGPDAMILSNHRVDDGMELVAAIDYDDEEVAVLQQQRKARQAQSLSSEKQKLKKKTSSKTKKSVSANQKKAVSQQKPINLDNFSNKLQEVQLNINKSNKQDKHNQEIVQKNIKKLSNAYQQRIKNDELDHDSLKSSANASQNTRAGINNADKITNIMRTNKEKPMEEVMDEIHSLRELMEHQFATLSWEKRSEKSAIEVSLMKRMVGMGFSASICERIIHMIDQQQNIEGCWREALNLIVSSIVVLEPRFIDDGGVIALIGPTGVGKTTTIAKLAARYALQNSPNDVSLISTDSYRIAAHEQLRVYAKLLGISISVLDGSLGLDTTIEQFEDKNLVLIDTAGMGQKDERLQFQLDGLSSAGNQARVYLAISATSQAWVLEEIIEKFGGLNLSGCILTKVDEANTLGEILSVIIENNLPVACITNGQAVPEDLRMGSAIYLLNQALSMAEQRSHDMGEERMAAIFSKGLRYE